ncbi:MAG: PRC-barrel domain-containing protein [Pseudolysinimonas sp.]
MLRSLKELDGYTVSATDGEIGRVVDFLLDDDHWTVRHLVVQTGRALFLEGHRVLISPISFRKVEWSAQRFHLALTMDRIKNSPDVDVDKPVSRQHERDYNGYYGFPLYGRHSGVWGMGAYPGLLAAGTLDDGPAEHPDKSGDVHLRSANEVRGYHVQGTDDAIGHVEDFIVDDETWNVRYLVIDTSSWWFGKRVVLSPHWANRVNWGERKVYVDMSRQSIKDGPEWTPTMGVHREFERRIHEYYGRPEYWSGGQPSEKTRPPQDTERRPG